MQQESVAKLALQLAHNETQFNTKVAMSLGVYFTSMEHSDKACSVCLEPLTNKNGPAVGHWVNSVPHAFHKHCITPWLAGGNHSCPTCRERIKNPHVFPSREAAGLRLDIGSAVVRAAQENDLSLLQSLLAKGQISKEDRNEAVWSAAMKGNQSAVNALQPKRRRRY